MMIRKLTVNHRRLTILIVLVVCLPGVKWGNIVSAQDSPSADRLMSLGRTRVSINDGWRFIKYADAEDADALIDDVRPEVTDKKDDRPADTEPTEAEKVVASDETLKPWILPSGKAFVSDPAKRTQRPDGNTGVGFPFVQNSFDAHGTIVPQANHQLTFHVEGPGHIAATDNW
ncbi:hypothetical protein V7x_47840 [Crateriforma conspicua]|uniref:Uncharacterized protein n=1 Tax=Crateriforma conspicua TaxID=2527996 RepID=A0A5C6FRC9_9PLAN|nr:hypothetical protein V7x_47840 [Crateriforma conspicua]